MSAEISFIHNGQPKAQKRHRRRVFGNKTIEYDPSSKDKKVFLSQVSQYAPDEPLDGPLTVIALFGIKRPLTHYHKVDKKNVLRDDAPTFCDKRPDVDNYVKFVLDAMNGVFYEDDSRIAFLHACKFYSDTPCTCINISECVGGGVSHKQ